MRPRLSSADPTPTWPADDPFSRLDLETLFGWGPGVHHNDAGLPFQVSLPPGWTLAQAEALWRAHGDDCPNYEPGPDWWAWEEWGAPGGGA